MNEFTLTLKLDINKNEEAYFNKVFYYANHIYNVGVKEAKRRLNKLYKDKDYQAIMYSYSQNKELTNQQKAELKELRIKYKLNSKSSIEEYLKVNRQQFSKYIDATTQQMLANDIYRAIDKNLFGNGKDIKFKKYKDRKTISSKSNNQGIRFNKKYEVLYQNKSYKVIVKPNDYYAQTILSYINFEQSYLPRKDRWLKYYEYAINFCRIKRRRKGNHYVYYIELNLQGTPPYKKSQPKADKVGIDIGTSTIAIYSNTDILFKELNDGITNIDRQITILNRKADKLRRINNPDNYNEDGTIKKNSKYFKRVWYNSNQLKNIYNQISTLYNKRSAKLRQFHNILAKEIINYGNEIVIETMNYQNLAKKSNKTEINNKTGRYKRKKRFGKSIGIHAPAQLISIIKTKLSYEQRTLTVVNNKAIKASQYNHITGEYVPTKLSDRWKNLSNNIYVQRDLYSAFILANIKNTEEIDIQSCIDNFSNFLDKHNQLIKDLYNQQVNSKHIFPSCMGINKKYIPNYIIS